MRPSGETGTATWGVRWAVNPGVELRTWRARRRLSLRALASRVSCDYGYLGKIENGKANLTQGMAVACDQALGANGALIRAWKTAQGSVRPAQLPAAPALLLGRENELAALAAGLRSRDTGSPRVAAIDGAAGVGKTALALRLAHDISHQYVDGHLYADFGGFAPPEKAASAGKVLMSFLTAMGATLVPDTAVERASLYRSLLIERNTLIVLDNVNDLDDVEQLMPASPGCAVLVTSRRALPSLVARHNATRVVVRPLSEDKSIELMSIVIGNDRAEAAGEAMAMLARRCGHLPLALALAAEQIAMYPNRPVVELVDEMIDDEDRLRAWGNTNLREVLSWSYRNLSPDAALLFQVFSQHRDSHLSVAAAAALAGVPALQVRRLLHQLASLHLVEIDSDQVIRLHEVVRAYGRDLATAVDAEEQRIWPPPTVA
ncbi:hypothetical protein BU204_37665 [Actinophytocola xanthii]|uniref:HTH cro/C1-type domain-containing protein n=1 Tax=Actinophytocola xanthii TaxID=1912961 RepID=A0A1Q8BR34_9PSEU|nr:hypothetical protein BU204_37665 [Actinophytocola xanthii]